MVRAESTRYSRCPVYDGSFDNVVGIMHVRDLFKHRHERSDAFVLRASMRAPLLVPEQKYAAELLEEMRAKRRHIAVVIDEYGGTAGLVTHDDLLAALVGPIDSRPPIDAASAQERLDPDGSLLLDGFTRVDEFLEVAGLRLDDDETEGVESLGGLISAVLGRFPETGETVVIGNRVVRVEKRDGVRVETVRLLPRVAAPAASASDADSPDSTRTGS
jgi:CBS domain containing-hemolysin-like protein